jgi:hypothetical protein
VPTSPTSAPAAGAGCSGSPAPAARDKTCHCPARPRPGSTPTSPPGPARPAIKRYSRPGPVGGYSPPTYARPCAASPPGPGCPPTRLATWDRGRSASPLPRCIFRPGRPPAATAVRRMPAHAPPSDPSRPGIQIHHYGPEAGLTAAPAALNTPPGRPGRAYHPRTSARSAGRRMSPGRATLPPCRKASRTTSMRLWKAEASSPGQSWHLNCYPLIHSPVHPQLHSS